MSARWATVLSLGGVLFAGTAAAVVNTRVLGSSGSANGFGSEISVAVAAPSTVSSTVAPASGEPTMVSTTVASDAAAASQATYQVGDAGAVTLDTAGGVLTVVAAVPRADWSVVKVEQVDAANVEVRLQSGGTVMEFRANLLFGVVNTSVESKAAGSQPTGATTATVPTSARPPSTQATTPAGSASVPTVTVDDHGSDDGSDDHGSDDGSDDHGGGSGNSGSGGGGDDSGGDDD